MSFGGSWVFLYPIAEHSVGAWDDLAPALFSISVLVVGLSIFAYCFGILATVTGPGLQAAPGRIGSNRVGIALGLGILLAQRFAREAAACRTR